MASLPLECSLDCGALCSDHAWRYRGKDPAALPSKPRKNPRSDRSFGRTAAGLWDTLRNILSE